MNDRLQQAQTRPAPIASTDPVTVGMALGQALDTLAACHAVMDRLEAQILGPRPTAGGEKDPEPSGVADQALRARSAAMVLHDRLDKLSNVV